jgi:hypothetical protein
LIDRKESPNSGLSFHSDLKTGTCENWSREGEFYFMNAVSAVSKRLKNASDWLRRTSGEKIVKFVAMIHTMEGMLILKATPLLAVTNTTTGAGTANTDTIDNFIDFACEWLQKIGAVIALVGGVMFALGWQRDDAEGKSRGLMTIMAGFMLVAVATSKQLFGL